MARVLAAKAAIGIRVDALSDWGVQGEEESGEAPLDFDNEAGHQNAQSSAQDDIGAQQYNPPPLEQNKQPLDQGNEETHLDNQPLDQDDEETHLDNQPLDQDDETHPDNQPLDHQDDYSGASVGGNYGGDQGGYDGYSGDGQE